MYKIEVDRVRKTINLVIMGLINIEEAKKLEIDMKELYKCFKEKEVILLSYNDYFTLSNDSKFIINRVHEGMVAYCKKVAIVQKRGMTEYNALEKDIIKNKLGLFESIDKAIRYLIE